VRVVYSPRAIRDLEHIAAYYRSVADPNIAAAISQRIQHVINRIARRPQSAPPVYRVRDDAVEILHIRHTARRAWAGDTE
jgi:toxin ParE1/3/4